MPGHTDSAMEMIRRQVKELDQIVAQAMKDLNAIRGIETMRKWKARTAGLLAEQVGAAEAQRFSAKGTGPAFANDLQEEMQDEAEEYRTFLLSLLEDLRKRAAHPGPPPS
ncbi:hypothetical protein [Nitrospira sp. Kam-Ns4a]